MATALVKRTAFALVNQNVRRCLCQIALAEHVPKPLKTDLPVDQVSLKNEAQWLHIPNEVYESLSFDVGLRRSFRRMANTIRDCSFLIRRPSLDVINALGHTNPDNPVVRYLLYGRYGCGKTTAIHHVLYWASARNWMICWFPRTYVYRRNVEQSIQSTWKNGRIDLPEEAGLWLNQFHKANARLLNNPKLLTTKKYDWAPGEVTDAGRPLTDLIKTGTTRIKTASDCMAALLKELKHYASRKEIKLLVALDQVNSLFGPTLLRRVDNYYAEPSDVTIMRAILDLLTFDWNNGAVVATIDPMEKSAHKHNAPPTAHLPYYLLGRDGMNYLEPFVPIEVPEYTLEEAYSCIDYYVDRHWLINTAAQTPEGREEMFRLAGYNPYIIELMCSEH